MARAVPSLATDPTRRGLPATFIERVMDLDDAMLAADSGADALRVSNRVDRQLVVTMTFRGQRRFTMSTDGTS
jgi:hypothetical protein